MVSTRSEKPICAPLRLPEVSPTLPLKQFQCSSHWLTMAFSRPFKEDRRKSLFFYASLHGNPSLISLIVSVDVKHQFTYLLAIDAEMPLALCPQEVSQAPLNFRSSETKATCDWCFALQSVGSFVSLLPVCLLSRSHLSGRVSSAKDFLSLFVCH